MNWFRRPTFLRLLHASPDAPAVDVYANDRKIASNLKFKDLTDYINIRPGRYQIKVYPAGKRKTPVLEENVVIQSGSVLTVSVIGGVRNLSLSVIEDPTESPRRDTAYIRAVHLSFNAPAGDIKLDNRTVFRNLAYRGATRYASVDPGTYDLNIYRAGTNNKVLEITNLLLQPEFYYTVFVLGLVNGEPPLQDIVSIDGLYRFIY